MRTFVIANAGQAQAESRAHRIAPNAGATLDSRKQAGWALYIASAWRVSILVAFVLLTFPPCFGKMGTGLDGSWPVGLNWVSAQHLVFGRDIAFTYGPLGFVITPWNVGANLEHAVLFRVGLHLFWWTSVGMLLFRTTGFVTSLLFASASILSGIHFGPSWDVNYMLTGVIYLTAIGYLVLGHIDRQPLWGIPAAIVGAAAILAKFNIGVACAGALAVWTVVQMSREPGRAMLIRLGFVALAYGGALIILFRIYGGPIGALGDFFKYSQELASGFSSQMSSSGSMTELTVVAVLVALTALASVASLALRARCAPVLLIILFPLFVLFKSAFIRHESGHFLTSCPGIVGLSGFLLPVRGGRLYSFVSQGLVALCLLGVSWLAPSDLLHTYARGVYNLRGLATYHQSIARIRDRDLKVTDQLKLPPAFLSRIGGASMDVYPWDICTAVANDLNWKPRFVFQSYAAYTPILDRKSAEHFRGKDAPEYILYRYEAIDGQHPCIVDPRTWSEICRWYDVVDQANGTLLLRRGDSARWDQVAWMGSRSIEFGERWEVPTGGEGQVYLQAKLKPSPLGRLVCALYKIYPPTIRIEYRDGTAAEHRLVWQNLESGFLVSSLPRSINGIVQLLDRGEADRVHAISFHDGGGAFERTFGLTWYRLPANAGHRTRQRAAPAVVLRSASAPIDEDKSPGPPGIAATPRSERR